MASAPASTSFRIVRQRPTGVNLPVQTNFLRRARIKYHAVLVSYVCFFCHEAPMVGLFSALANGGHTPTRKCNLTAVPYIAVTVTEGVLGCLGQLWWLRLERLSLALRAHCQGFFYLNGQIYARAISYPRCFEILTSSPGCRRRRWGLFA